MDFRFWLWKKNASAWISVPQNFMNISTFPGDAVVAPVQLNTILAAVNKNFVAEFPSTSLD